MKRFALLLVALLSPVAATATSEPTPVPLASSISYSFTLVNPAEAHSGTTCDALGFHTARGRGITEDITVTARAVAAIPPWSQTFHMSVAPGQRQTITASHNSYAILFDVQFNSATPFQLANNCASTRCCISGVCSDRSPDLPPIVSTGEFTGTYAIIWSEINCLPGITL